MHLRLGTRTSRLALWQAAHVESLLRDAAGIFENRAGIFENHTGTFKNHTGTFEISTVTFQTAGDRNLDAPLPEIGGKGLFTAELEEALRRGRLDLAVHSLKDLPTQQPEGLVIAAMPVRGDPRDVLVSPSGTTLSQLPKGARVGTSSPRRAAQILRLRPDLVVGPIRGNVPTRLVKVRAGEYDAVVLAAAGLERLALLDSVSQFFEPDEMLPAPGQGAVAVQCRADDTLTLRLLEAITHTPTARAVLAERAFLSHIQGGCSSPVGAFGLVQAENVVLKAAVIARDGSRRILVEDQGVDPDRLGRDLAERALQRGAATLLQR